MATTMYQLCNLDDNNWVAMKTFEQLRFLEGSFVICMWFKIHLELFISWVLSFLGWEAETTSEKIPPFTSTHRHLKFTCCTSYAGSLLQDK